MPINKILNTAKLDTHFLYLLFLSLLLLLLHHPRKAGTPVSLWSSLSPSQRMAERATSRREPGSHIILHMFSLCDYILFSQPTFTAKLQTFGHKCLPRNTGTPLANTINPTAAALTHTAEVEVIPILFAIQPHSNNACSQ